MRERDRQRDSTGIIARERDRQRDSTGIIAKERDGGREGWKGREGGMGTGGRERERERWQWIKTHTHDSYKFCDVFTRVFVASLVQFHLLILLGDLLVQLLNVDLK